jgi:DNA-binding FadR family transcriptional regulator
LYPLSSASSDRPDHGLTKVRVPKASELIADELRSQIVRGTLEEGSSLPSETELMTNFGVSRPTLREAFRILESERLISIGRGSRGGARVHLPDISVAANYTGLLLQARGCAVSDVYDARMVLEPPIARMCAEHCTAEHLCKMYECIELEEAAIEVDATLFAHHAAHFHQLLIAGSGNTSLQVLAGLLSHIIEKHLSAEMLAKPSAARRRADNRQGVRSHRKLLKLIETGDGAGAEEYWRAHMDAAGKVMLRTLGPATVVDLLSPKQSRLPALGDASPS